MSILGSTAIMEDKTMYTRSKDSCCVLFIMDGLNQGTHNIAKICSLHLATAFWTESVNTGFPVFTLLFNLITRTKGFFTKTNQNCLRKTTGVSTFKEKKFESKLETTLPIPTFNNG